MKAKRQVLFFSKKVCISIIITFVLLLLNMLPVNNENLQLGIPSSLGRLQPASGASTVFANVSCRSKGEAFQYGSWISVTPNETRKVGVLLPPSQYTVTVLVDINDLDGVVAAWIMSERLSDGLTINNTMHWLEGNGSLLYPPVSPEEGGPIITNNTYFGGFSAIPENSVEYWSFLFYARDATGEISVSEEYHIYVSVNFPHPPPTTTPTNTTSDVLAPEILALGVIGSAGFAAVVIVAILWKKRFGL